MPSRAGGLLSAIFINFLISVPLVATAWGEPATPEDCLSAPTGETPPGSHWRYRTDHVNDRKCWYLRRDGASQAQSLPQNSAAAAPQPPAKPSISDARAELRSQAQVREEAPASSPAASVASSSANTTTNLASGSVNAPLGNVTPAVTTRWPADVPAANATPVAAAPANDDPQPSSDPAQAIVPSIPFTNFSVPMQRETLLTLIAAAIGALAFAGFAALVTKRGRGRPRRRVVQSARARLSETTDDDRIVLSDQPYPDHREYRPRFARGVPSAASIHRARESVRRSPRQASR